MKKVAIVPLCIVLFAYTCEDNPPADGNCVRGTIVGERCGVFALQVEKGILGATDWQGPPDAEGVAKIHKNVIGLIGLPEVSGLQGKVLFVSLRNPTDEDSAIPCYLHMPSPPAPHYVVLHASEVNCNETAR